MEPDRSVPRRPRPKRGTGHGVYFDKERGTWAYKFIVGGQLFKARRFGSADEALAACQRERHKADQALHRTLVGVPTFKEAADLYLADRQAHLASASRTKYQEAFGRMAQRGWMARSLDELTTEDVQAYCARRLTDTWRDRPVKGATVNRDLAALSALLTWGKARGWVEDNVAVAAKVTRYDEPWRPYQTVTDTDLAVMLTIMQGNDKHTEVAAKCELLALLGVRLRVVLCLRWEQADLDSHVLQYRSKGHDHTRYLPDRAVDILRSLGPQPTGYVWQTQDVSTFRRRWNRARVAIGKPTLRPHDLRVTFARRMADAGTDPITIRDMLGHTTLTMTQRYIPSTVRSQEAAYRRLLGVPNIVPTPARMNANGG